MNAKTPGKPSRIGTRKGTKGLARLALHFSNNQSTVRILEPRKYPAFRHTDKTQRVNLAWLAEQFRRKHYQLVHAATVRQSADICTKPFTNSEKWNDAPKLISHIKTKPGKREIPEGRCSTPRQSERTQKPAAAASSPTPRCIEVCCGEGSKLGDMSRSTAAGCQVFWFTLNNDFNLPEN